MAELNELDAAYKADDLPELGRIVAVIQERAERGERPSEDELCAPSKWRVTPQARVGGTMVPSVPEPAPATAAPLSGPIVAAVRDARAEGHTAYVMPNGVVVTLAFEARTPPLELDDPEPVPIEELAEEPPLAELVSVAEPKPPAAVESRKPRTDEFAPAAFASRSQRSRPREGTAGEILEREF